MMASYLDGRLQLATTNSWPPVWNIQNIVNPWRGFNQIAMFTIVTGCGITSPISCSHSGHSLDAGKDSSARWMADVVPKRERLMDWLAMLACLTAILHRSILTLNSVPIMTRHFLYSSRRWTLRVATHRNVYFLTIIRLSANAIGTESTHALILSHVLHGITSQNFI